MQLQNRMKLTIKLQNRMKYTPKPKPTWIWYDVALVFADVAGNLGKNNEAHVSFAAVASSPSSPVTWSGSSTLRAPSLRLLEPWPPCRFV